MKDPYRPGIISDKGVFRGYGWFHVPLWNTTIAAPPKCGSSSLKQFMNDMRCSYIPQNQVRGPCAFVVREPLSRFCSLWRSKCRDGARIADEAVFGMSPSELIEHIERGAMDVHWTPQYKLIGNLKPRLIPLERFNNWIRYASDGELQTFNATHGPVDVDAGRVLRFYERDVVLYNRSIMSYAEAD